MKDFYRNNVVELALTKLGKLYVWGAIGDEEFDCSGFTYYIYKELFNIDINETGYGTGDTTKQMTNNIGILKQYNEEDPNKKKYIKEIKIADLVFFHRQSLDEFIPTPSNRYPGHVGIYLGNNKFIHASGDAGKIIISEFDEYWTKVLVASRDIIEGIIK